jgi:hypothetical protein
VKVFLDHNMSPAIARALHALFDGDHEVVALSAKFPRTISDVDWIKALSAEGHWVVISGDRRITRNKAEFHTFRNSKLTGFFLAPGLHKSPVIKQTERILALWPAIETLSATVQPGAVYELPVRSNQPRQLNP